MLIMNKKNIIDIYNGKKIATLRPIKRDGKGYLKVGTIQEIRLTHFDNSFYLKVRIIKRKVIDINQLKQKHFLMLGYDSKDEYLNEEFNITNDSPYRVIYFFKLYEVNMGMMKKLI